MIRMKSNKYLYLIVMTCSLLLVVLMGTLSYAWLAGSGSVPCEVDGSILSNYFHSGNGSEENPFVITEPKHYYNMVYLYQLKEDFVNDDYYFQLGADDLTTDEEGFFVYGYDENGELDRNTYAKTLDMKEYADGLLPIGTAKTPFVGHFNGNGLTVSNLTVISSIELTGINGTEEYTTSDVGIFGYVGTFTPENGEAVDATITDVYYDNVTIKLNKADAAQECQGNNGLHTQGADRVVYVGYLAGHIKTSSKIQNVYINNCTIEGGSILNTSAENAENAKAHSKFGYFGCIEDQDGEMISEISSRVTTQRTVGEDAGFGGSLDMESLFSRILTVLESDESAGNTYPTSETVDIIPDSNIAPEVTIDSTGTTSTNGLRTYYSATGGNYIGSVFRGTQIATFLYSLTSSQTTQVTTYTLSDNSVDAYHISYNGKYLALNGTTVTAVTQNTAAAKWLVDGNGHWYTYIRHTAYYLNRSGVGIVIEDTTAQNATVWARSASGADDSHYTLSTTIDGTAFYLFFNGITWELTPFSEYWAISDATGEHFISKDVSGIIDVPTAGAAIPWIVTENGDGYTFYTFDGTAKRYLGYNSRLTTTPTEFIWHKEIIGQGTENEQTLFYTTPPLGNERFYLTYTENDGWQAILRGASTISNGASAHLSVNSSHRVVNADSAAQSVSWLFTSASGDTQIYTILGDGKYFLTASGASFGLSMVREGSGTPTTWHRSGNSLYITEGGINYYLQYYNGGWFVLPQASHLISDGSGNYMQVNGINSFGSTPDTGNATRFYFSSAGGNPSGTIRYIYSGEVRYLDESNGSFANAETHTPWVNNGTGHIFYNNLHFIKRTETGEWQIATRPYLYTIQANGVYLVDNNGVLGTTTTANQATLWSFSNVSDLNAPEGIIRSWGQGDNPGKYLYVSRGETQGECGNSNTYTYTLSLEATSQNWERTTTSGGVVKYHSGETGTDNYYLTFSGGLQVSGTTDGADGESVTLNRSNDRTLSDIYATASPQSNASSPSLTVNSNGTQATAMMISDPVYPALDLHYADTKQQLYTSDSDMMRRGTYIPIRTRENAASSSLDLYPVHPDNTGYIVGGAYSTNTNGGQGDIRVSRYGIGNIGGSYSNKNLTEVLTYNIDENGTITRKTIEAFQESGVAFKLYDNVKTKFLDMLARDDSYVYGLHFMDAAIGTGHVIQAEKVTILGQTYVNYELPESCIDFNVREHGYITFMAGAYFNAGTQNDAFFSLHRVYRNADQTIAKIMQISKIYSIEGGDNYVYEYSGGTFTNEDGTYTPNDGDFASSDDLLDAGYQVVFDTAWIMNNPEIKTDRDDIYYFEIPCNEGEYALGSVSGKTGAYLLYLDIGSNSGEATQTELGSYNDGENNPGFSNRHIDFRAKNDIKPDWSLMQFQINCPSYEVENPEVSSKFEVSVSYIETQPEVGGGYYDITVKNTSGHPVELWVYLYDDDDTSSNEYHYSYRVQYINGTHSDATIIQTSDGQDYWKSAAGFRIPSTGDATEQNYNTVS